MKTRHLLALGLCSLLLLQTSITAAEQPLVVHEWGTFTSLQNEAGETIGGINTDDEPVPDFVHRVAHLLLLSPNEIRNRFAQGVPHCHPDVTMRLETPVVYFHVPRGGNAIRTIDVDVKFRGGWLTEFYPRAIAEAPGVIGDSSRLGPYRFGKLTPETLGSLRWPRLQVGGQWSITNTTEHVWTSPRNVHASLVRATNNEAEKFLFYRGVGNVEAPLRVARDAATDQLIIRGQLNIPGTNAFSIQQLWLVDIHRDGQLAFRKLPGIELQANSTRFLAKTSASFPNVAYSRANLHRLRTDLLNELVADGLFRDEAEALLNTWELSYFKSEGLRLFFLVPRPWTDHYLPLEIPEPATVTRVMVGRIELITPQHQKLLARIASYSPEAIRAAAGALSTNFYTRVIGSGNTAWQEMTTGNKPLSAHIKVPREFQTYIDLGRFRNALILHAARQPATAGATNFINRFGLNPYRTSPPAEASAL